MANSHNKTQLISLLSDVFQASGVEVLIAENDADTLIVKTAIIYGITKDVEVRVEDTAHCCYLSLDSSLSNNESLSVRNNQSRDL